MCKKEEKITFLIYVTIPNGTNISPEGILTKLQNSMTLDQVKEAWGQSQDYVMTDLFGAMGETYFLMVSLMSIHVRVKIIRAMQKAVILQTFHACRFVHKDITFEGLPK